MKKCIILSLLLVSTNCIFGMENNTNEALVTNNGTTSDGLPASSNDLVEDINDLVEDIIEIIANKIVLKIYPKDDKSNGVPRLAFFATLQQEVRKANKETKIAFITNQDFQTYLNKQYANKSLDSHNLDTDYTQFIKDQKILPK